jgi:hypothetical protein
LENISVKAWMVIILKITKVVPILPSQKANIQDQYTETAYFPRRKPKISFKSLLEKELHSQVGSKIIILF